MQGFERDRLRRLQRESHDEEASHKHRGRGRPPKAKKRRTLVAGIASPFN